MKTAFLFPGQGSQKIGMGKTFMAHSIAQRRLEEASEILKINLKKLCLEGPQKELTLTKNAQPAILAISVIAFEVFQERHQIQADWASGHSLGEYSALVAAGTLSFSEAISAVRIRGTLMQEAVPPGVGGMAAMLGMSADMVEQICQEESQGQIVSPANFNAKGQIVIAGHNEAVERVLKRGKGKKLDVSAPFHCALMAPIQPKLKERLENIAFKEAHFPVVNNADNDFLTYKEQYVPSLIKQVISPVRWESGILKMASLGLERVIEFGEGSVLTGMMKRIDKNIKTDNINSLEAVDNFFS